MKKYYLSPFIFFKIEKEEVLLWNYQTHEQFLINSQYFTEMMRIDATGKADDETIARDLLDSNIISTQPFEDYEWGWDEQSKIFHIGTSNIASVSAEMPELDEEMVAETYLEQCKQMAIDSEFYLEKKGPLIDLPAPNKHLLKQSSFLETMMERKTCRVFTGETVSLEALSTLLFFTFGLVHETWPEFKELGLKQTALHKVSPSGGGRHPEEAFIVVYNVKDLKPGLYHYRPQDHKLTLMREGEFEEEVLHFNNNQIFSKGLAFGVYIVACFNRTWDKYKHSRAYRVVYLDIGHASQTLQLCATALGLNTWLCGGFEDEKVCEFLDIRPIKQSPILFVGIGKGTGQAIPQAMYNRLKSMK